MNVSTPQIFFLTKTDGLVLTLSVNGYIKSVTMNALDCFSLFDRLDFVNFFNSLCKIFFYKKNRILVENVKWEKSESQTVSLTSLLTVNGTINIELSRFIIWLINDNNRRTFFSAQCNLIFDCSGNGKI